MLGPANNLLTKCLIFKLTSLLILLFKCYLIIRDFKEFVLGTLLIYFLATDQLRFIKYSITYSLRFIRYKNAQLTLVYKFTYNIIILLQRHSVGRLIDFYFAKNISVENSFPTI